jgi:hypothetical protein
MELGREEMNRYSPQFIWKVNGNIRPAELTIVHNGVEFQLFMSIFTHSFIQIIGKDIVSQDNKDPDGISLPKVR